MPRKRREREPTAKWKAIKELLQAIREQPRSIGEILEIKKEKNVPGKAPDKVKQFPQPRTTINNWLAEPLEVLGLIYYNPKDRRWYPSESKRPEFGIKEYELALKHSRYIVLGTNERQGVANYATFALLGEFSLGSRSRQRLLGMNVEYEHEFFSHIETGYPAIYSDFEKYKDLFLKRRELVKTIREDSQRKGMALDLPFLGATLWLRRYSDQIPEKNREQLKKLIEQMEDIATKVGGQLARVFLQVNNGIPLAGYCDCCPHREVRIKE